MKDKFIAFLRKNHAWAEFKKELYAQNKLGDIDNALFDVFEYVEERSISQYVLANGSFFFWDKARGETDWEALSNAWAELISEDVTDTHVVETELPHNMMVNSRDLGNGNYEINGVRFKAKNHASAVNKYARTKKDNHDAI